MRSVHLGVLFIVACHVVVGASAHGMTALSSGSEPADTSARRYGCIPLERDAEPVPAMPSPPQGMQTRTRRMVFGLETMMLRYSGDIDNNTMFSKASSDWQFSAVLVYMYRVFTQRRQTYSLLLRTEAGYYPMRASSEELSFTNAALGLSVGIELEFFLRSPVRPFVHFGVGVLSFLADATYAGSFRDRFQEKYRGTSTMTATLPFGFGIQYQAGRQIDLSVQFTKTLTFTDNLDGWESGIKDNFQSVRLGVLYYLR
jgi:hypothetical protein